MEEGGKILKNDNTNNQKKKNQSKLSRSQVLEPQKKIKTEVQSSSCSDNYVFNKGNMQEQKRNLEGKYQEKNDNIMGKLQEMYSQFIDNGNNIQEIPTNLNNPNMSPTNLNYLINQRIIPKTFSSSSNFPQSVTMDQLNQNIDYLQRLKQYHMNSMSTTVPNIMDSRDPVTNDVRFYFQQIFNILSIQNSIMENLQLKSVQHANDLKEITQELKKVRHSYNDRIKDEKQKHKCQSDQSDDQGQAAAIKEQIENSNTPLTLNKMFKFLFKKNEADYQYKLILMHQFQVPLYRERNFTISVLLVDREERPVINSNRIPMTLALYSTENPPKLIETNTSGNQILKGFIEKDLCQGTVSFDQIQIKEVTSHFRNGWIYLVLFPQPISVDSAYVGILGSPIDFKDIRPLILDQIIVKAQKLKQDQIKQLIKNTSSSKQQFDKYEFNQSEIYDSSVKD